MSTSICELFKEFTTTFAAMTEEEKKKLKESLDHAHKWPSLYMFKFIVPTVSDKYEQLVALFPENADVLTKQSSSGKFTSITIKEVMMNADDVISRHEKASKIEGVISL